MGDQMLLLLWAAKGYSAAAVGGSGDVVGAIVADDLAGVDADKETFGVDNGVEKVAAAGAAAVVVGGGGIACSDAVGAVGAVHQQKIAYFRTRERGDCEEDAAAAEDEHEKSEAEKKDENEVEDENVVKAGGVG
mmetsp:Transcript_45054/g.88438  ORF Transcript_45054/g.88438 Transcript_45054/m.88438 type:complete len:134 (-) Transcript_45054:269-670(-)